MAVELNNSWKFRETVEGQEFTRLFYAPWDEVFSIGGASSVLPAVGDSMPETSMPNRPDLKVIEITADPQMGDKLGCHVQIVYSNVTKETFPKKVANSRMGWDERFYSVSNIVEVDQYYDAEKKDYTGGTFTKAHMKTGKGEIIPQPITKPTFVYDLTVRLSSADLNGVELSLGTVNETLFWQERSVLVHEGVHGQDDTYAKAEAKIGNYTLEVMDKQKWLLASMSINRDALDIYALSLEFQYKADKWNNTARDGGALYPETDLGLLVTEAKLASGQAPMGGTR